MDRDFDHLGDADELSSDEEVPPATVRRMDAAALGLGSLVLGVSSTLLVLPTQVVLFTLLSNPLRDQTSLPWLAVWLMGPTAAFALVGLGLGVTGVRRRDDRMWPGAVAFAGTVLGAALVALLVVVLVLVLRADPPPDGFLGLSGH
jgi:hypothetical protein